MVSKTEKSNKKRVTVEEPVRRPSLEKDGSESTLISTDSTAKTPKQSLLDARETGPLTKEKPKRGPVSFNQRVVWYADLERNKEDLSRTWYQDEDYDRFKKNAQKTIVKIMTKIQEKGESFPETMKEIYEAACNESSDRSALSSKQKARLAKAYNKVGGRKVIGLEFHVLKMLRQEAIAKRDELQVLAFVSQPEYVVSDPQEIEAIAEELRDNCMNITHSWRIFAHYLAQVHDCL